MSAARAVLAAVAVLAALALAASGAAAHPHHAGAVAWTGSFDLSVEGRQSDDWEWHHAPENQCDSKIDGSGSESDELLRGSSIPAFVTGVGPTVTAVIAAGTVHEPVALSRDGSVTEVDPPPTAAEECDLADGGGAEEPPGADCGARTGSVDLLVAPGSGGPRLEADSTSFATTPIAKGYEPQAPYRGCPNLGAYLPDMLPVELTSPIFQGAPPGAGALGPTSFDLHGSAVEAEVDRPDITGTNRVELTGHLRGLALVPEILARNSDVPIAADGGAEVSLSCPRHLPAPCTGTLAAMLDPAEEPPSRFPAPLLGRSAHLGHASAFSIPSGRHRAVHLSLHVPRRSLRALAGVPLWLVVTQHDRRGRRVAAAVALGHTSR